MKTTNEKYLVCSTRTLPESTAQRVSLVSIIWWISPVIIEFLIWHSTLLQVDDAIIFQVLDKYSAVQTYSHDVIEMAQN